ncbi:uncharacterized protein LOC131143474 isoform X3 [Malania oleifera]|uniref:uncharacterized protein LOC131143474 isoform X3 n=1 Tax=Malania oleifera TaxID=397392 RepID=UPI0025AE6A2A|nr:uncharacterized protein LOC131143474 isoform X3 [Malania oleifera]
MAFWPGLITLGLEPHSQDVAGDDPSVTDSPSICLRCNASGNVMPKRTSLGSRSIPESMVRLLCVSHAVLVAVVLSPSFCHSRASFPSSSLSLLFAGHCLA